MGLSSTTTTCVKKAGLRSSKRSSILVHQNPRKCSLHVSHSQELERRDDVHWQDADSSSSNAVSEVFPAAKIMICGGHAGRAHKTLLQVRAKQKSYSDTFIAHYEKQYPEVLTLTCHCRGKHKAGCGCLSVGFIGKAHTDFSSIRCQSQEEFTRRISALPNHAHDEHEWDGGRCDFHPLWVCTCEQCENKGEIKCVGMPYQTKLKLSCPFHYEIECKENAS